MNIAIKKFEKAGTDAVRKLRIDKLKHGKPFMINSAELPSNQCYLEYPDGKVDLVKISSPDHDFTLIRTLSAEEVLALRKKYRLKSV